MQFVFVPFVFRAYGPQALSRNPGFHHSKGNLQVLAASLRNHFLKFYVWDMNFAAGVAFPLKKYSRNTSKRYIKFLFFNDLEKKVS